MSDTDQGRDVKGINNLCFERIPGASIVVQQVKAICIKTPVLVLATLFLMQLPVNASGRDYCPRGRPGWVVCLLSAAWPTADCCGHLGHEQRPLSVSFPPFFHLSLCLSSK